jgi:hypothetical protein
MLEMHMLLFIQKGRMKHGVTHVAASPKVKESKAVTVSK